ncbi:MAG: Hpt domain-containing protein, partial [Chloroflexus sp.]
MDLTSFYAQFRDETADNLRVLNDALLAIEGQAGETLRRSELDRAFRAAHTIKGAARMLGFDPIAQVAHALEHVLDEIRQEQRVLDRPLADLLLRGGDLIGQLAAEAPQMSAPALAAVSEIVQALGVASPAKPAAASSSPPAAVPQPPPVLAETAPRAARQTVRVRVDRLDRLFNLAGELAVHQQWLGEVGQELYRLQEAVERQQRAVQALERELARLRFSPTQRQALDARLATLRDAQAALADLAQRQSDRLDRHLARQQMLVKDLEQEVMAVRLLPIATIFNTLPRLVRDLAA